MATQYTPKLKIEPCFMGRESEGIYLRRTLCSLTPTGQAQEHELERMADNLLRGAGEDEAYPAYTDAQLARHGRGVRLPLQEEHLALAAATQTRQDFLNDLKFMAGLTALTRAERRVLDAWIQGQSQNEIVAQWPCGLGRVQQQQVSRLLRKALEKCYALWELSFTQFSRHTIYRRPARHYERNLRVARTDTN